MGWLYFQKPDGIKAWFEGTLTWETDTHKNTCIKSAIKFKVAYAAVERVHKETGERIVWAAIYLLNYTREPYYNFGYKDMDETCGPYETDCPESILQLLTPTDHEFANNWRKKCWARIHDRKNRPTFKVGDAIAFETPIKFNSGVMAQVFRCVDKRRKVFSDTYAQHPTYFKLKKRTFETNKYRILTELEVTQHQG